MCGQIAPLAAIVMHGNARLDYGHECDDLLSMFEDDQVASITFCDAVSRDGPIVAESVEAWHRGLIEQGARYLQLHHHQTSKLLIAERMTAGFVNGGPRWLIESCYGFRSDFWESNWTRTNGGWCVEVGRVQAGSTAAALDVEPLEPLCEVMEINLNRLAAVARDNDQPEYAGRFQRAADAFADHTPQITTYPDLAPVGLLPAEATRLLAAASAAWVFGPGETWNDLIPTRRAAEYEPLTDELYRLISRAVCAATNTTALPLARGRR